MKKKIIIISLVIFGILLITGSLVVKMLENRSINSHELGSEPIGEMDQAGNYSSPSAVELNQKASLVQESRSQFSGEGDENLAAAEKKIIKNGNLNLKVVKIDKSVEEISKIAKNNGGDIFSTNFFQNSKNVKSGTITVKVPVNNFEKAFSEIKEIANFVMRESISGQDVTEQYTDLKSRLKNKQAEEQSFVNILGRASTVEDILKVTKELSRVRGEIEILEGRIKLLESQTDMATISISLSEDSEITITDSWRPLRVIKDTVNSLLKDIQGFINFTIVFIIRVIPVIILYLLLVLVLFLIGKKIYRKIKNRKTDNESKIS